MLMVAELFAQNIHNAKTLVDKVAIQLSLYPKEKVHLHIDRLAYLPGDTLWFSAYLVHSTFHTPLHLSKYIYVELINPFGGIIERVKIKEDDNQYLKGYVPISLETPAGNYTLRAYSRYMFTDPDAVFTRDLQILPSLEWKDTKEEISISMDKKERFDLKIKLSDMNSNGNFSIKKGEIFLESHQGTETRSRVTNEGIEAVLKDKDMAGNHSMLLKIMDKHDRILCKYLPLSTGAQDYEVTFYPEGGYLISGDTCKVAFKALDKSGNHASVNFTLHDNLGKEIASGKSFYRGMGYFEFQPLENEHYWMVTKNEKGVCKKFLLPASINGAVGIKMKDDKEKFYLSISGADKVFDKEYYLVIHIRGAILYERWICNSEDSVITINKKDCPAGVVQCLLLNKQLKPISERLCFVPSNQLDEVNCQFETEKDGYTPHELIRTNVQLRGKDGKFVKSRLSVAITDTDFALVDTTFHIKSTLLLTSELKGRIECPIFYLQNSDSARMAVDLLMMIHGWRRYDLSAIAQGVIKKSLEMPEYTSKISGKVRFKKGLIAGETGWVRIVGTGMDLVKEVLVDTLGRFTIDGLEFVNGTSFNLFGIKHSVVNEKALVGKTKLKHTDFVKDVMRIELDKESLFTEIIKTPQMLLNQSDFQAGFPFFRNYYARRRGFYLPEVLVKRRGNDLLNYSELNKNDILSLKSINCWELIEKLGIYTVPPKYTYGLGGRGSGSHYAIVYKERPVNVYLDARLYPHSILNFITPGNIASIKVYNCTPFMESNIRGQYSTPNSNYDKKNKSESILDIELEPSFDFRLLEIFNEWIKKYHIDEPRKNANIEIYPLGYQEPIEFYSPTYEKRQSDEGNDSFIPDFRPTIYWNPNLQTDTDGKCSFSFYAGDRSTTYSVVIEGIKDDGKLIQEVKRIKIK